MIKYHRGLHVIYVISKNPLLRFDGYFVVQNIIVSMGLLLYIIIFNIFFFIFLIKTKHGGVITRHNLYYDFMNYELIM